jgi:hypothetical protein
MYLVTVARRKDGSIVECERSHNYKAALNHYANLLFKYKIDGDDAEWPGDDDVELTAMSNSGPNWKVDNYVVTLNIEDEE